MIPLRDRNPTRRTPVVTMGLIAACFAVFAVELATSASGGQGALDAFIARWGAVPASIAAAVDAGAWTSPAMVGVIGSVFLHAGWLHLLGNMLYLWIFGNNVEDRLGRIPFLAFYLLGGVVAVFAQVWTDPTSPVPLVGASGAIAATLGAYLVMFPGARVVSLVFLGFFYQLLEVPAVILLGFWFVLQLVDGVASLGATTASGGVAFFAHIGGFVLGMAVGLLSRFVPGAAARPSSGALG